MHLCVSVRARECVCVCLCEPANVSLLRLPVCVCLPLLSLQLCPFYVYACTSPRRLPRTILWKTLSAVRRASPQSFNRFHLSVCSRTLIRLGGEGGIQMLAVIEIYSQQGGAGLPEMAAFT